MQAKRFSIVAILALCAFPWEQTTNAAAHALEQQARPRRVRRLAPHRLELAQLNDVVGPEVAAPGNAGLVPQAMPDIVPKPMLAEPVVEPEIPEMSEVPEAPAIAEDAAEEAEPAVAEEATEEAEMPEAPVVVEEVVAEVAVPAEMPAHSSERFSLARAFSTTTPVWLILILAFMWGVLVSFTPCVYPLIPITAAVMQSQATTSAARNFTLAASYVLGISVVYASLGFLAASTTVVFGQWVSSPWVIGFTVLFLIYLALSMFGFYSIYIPRMLTQRKGGEIHGSLLWSFLAGAIAGTVASPCLSPALFAVLLYVSSLGNPVIGFLTLFSFSLGMSVLLLVIGTSSAALSLLPRTGAWLYAVKNVFGYALLLLAVYFISLNPTLTFFGLTIPTGYATTAALVGAIALFAGLHYLNCGRTCLATKRPPRRIGEPLGEQHTNYIIHCTGGYTKIIVGILLIGLAALFFIEAYLARCGMALLNLW